MINFKNKNQKGYAILFTVIIVSAISVITAGLSNALYKQLILSSLAKDSQSAFYQADTAGDCALFADQVEYEGKYKATPTPLPSIFDGTTWGCGELSLTITPDLSGIANGYSLTPLEPNVVTPCFRINIKKVDNGLKDIDGNSIIDTTISAKGYNICSTSNLRTVEREIQINY